MSTLPKFAWHELLAPLKPPEPWSVELEAKFAAGRKFHARIEGMIGEAHLVEQEMVYHDPEFPFEVAYHPDILRQELSVAGVITTYVYEIKPLIWYLKNRTYCEAQLGGYQHFTGARDAHFILYQKKAESDDDAALSLFRPLGVPWDDLKALALRAYAEMLAR